MHASEHATDDEIRDLLTARMAVAPTPMSTDDLAARWRTAEPRAVGPIRRRSPLVGLLAAAATLALLVAGLFVVSNRDPGSSQPPAVEPPPGAKVGRYFLPETLPDGYRLLAVRERGGDPSEERPAQSVWERPDGLRMSLTDSRPEWRWADAADQVEVAGRTVSWSNAPAETGFPTTFQVDDGERLVDGSLRTDGVLDHDELIAVLSTVQPGADGVPIVDDPSWTLLASAPAVTGPVASHWTAYLGPPGGYLGANSIEIDVRRFTSPTDPVLELGTSTNTTEIGGRTVYLGEFDDSPRWFPAPDLEVQVRGYGPVDFNDVVPTIVEVDEAAIEAAMATIGESAAGLDVGESVTFPSAAVVDMLGDRTSPRGACLTVGDTRRCDLALMATAGYTFEDTIAITNTDFLIDGRWFSVGLEVHAVGDAVPAPLPVGAEVVALDDRTYYLLEHPPTAKTSTEPQWAGARGRPAR